MKKQIPSISLDEEACANFKDEDSNTIDVMVVESINDGIRATTYSKTRNTTDKAKYDNWIVLSSGVAGKLPNTLPHEIMHILLNIFHRPGEPSTALFHGNTSSNKDVSGTKRIGPYPDAAVATYTPMPSLTIHGIGNSDTTIMRANVETLP